MRRGFSIFLILFLGLGPLATALPVSDDLRLPSCCRRDGDHHCAMSMRIAAKVADAAAGTPLFTAPSTCPYFPSYAVAPTSTILALTASPINLLILDARAHPPAAGRTAARLSQIRTRAGRGPPA
jgi:hypothetical protein